MKAKLLGLLALVLVILAVGWVGSHYFGPKVLNLPSHGGQDNSRKNNNSTSTPTVDVNALIDFGNGTKLWFNHTVAPLGYDYYNVTYKVANGNVVAVWSDSLKSYFVYKIMGVGCDAGDFSCGYWSLWVWNDAKLCWDYSSLGVSWLKVSDFKMIAWYFNHYDTSSFPGRCV